MTNQTLSLFVDEVLVKTAQAEVLETGEPVFIFDSGMEMYLDDVVIR